MTIEEYEPRSMLVTRETPVRRAKFPFVDIHGHQDLTISDAELASLVKQMDAMNMRVMNNLSGGLRAPRVAQFASSFFGQDGERYLKSLHGNTLLTGWNRLNS